jgi:hypothetical protein
LRDVAGRVIDHLQGIGEPRDLRRLSEPCIVVAHDLAPSTTATLDREHVLGFATESGGRTSHTAIMARKLGIPAVVGLLFWPREDWVRWIALAIYVIAAVTDYFDGYLARAWHQQSAIGRMLDPIADKLLVASCLLMLAGAGLALPPLPPLLL